MKTYYRDVDTVIGRLRLVASDTHWLQLQLPNACQQPAPADWLASADLLPRAVAQLQAYLAGQRQTFAVNDFDLPCRWQGTAFQQQVWQALMAIPYGSTLSYGELARRIGRPRAVRAVGAANGANPFPLVAPCHRVIASNGQLHGYGGGLTLKQWLLDLEAPH